MKRPLLFIGLLFCAVHLLGQTFVITGTINASDDPLPLPGVNVAAKGTTIGTITDIDGNYSINVKKGDVLVFSYMGYKTVQQTVQQAGTMNITLDPENLMLEEVVAIGYGSMKK